MKAVILAGGHGKRLRPLTQDRPKALVDVGGKPIVEWQIRWLSSYGVKEFVVCAGYMKEKFFSVIGSGSKLGVKVYYSVEDEPLANEGGWGKQRNITFFRGGMNISNEGSRKET
jgi:NDP-sugar pyrophosphorylase family protein